MNTLQQDIDDLDRMVDSGTQKDAIRSQIRLISREIAVLEADNASLAQSHLELQEVQAKTDTAFQQIIATQAKEITDLRARERGIIDSYEAAKSAPQAGPFS